MIFINIFMTFNIVLSGLLIADTSQIRVDKEKKSINVLRQKATQSIPMELPKGFTIEAEPKIYNDKDFSLVIVEASKFDVATSVVYAIGKTGKLLWKKDIVAFNPSQPLIEKDHVYIAGIGVVFKVNKKSGKIVWSHSGLYEKENIQFEGATTIKRSGQFIEFEKNLLIDDASGKIQEVKK